MVSSCLILYLLAFDSMDNLSGRSVVDLFTALEYKHTAGEFEGHVFNFRMFVPEVESEKDRLPLIIWLHGEGESGGNDNVAQLRWLRLIFTDISDRSKYPFFLLAVQKPKHVPWFSPADELEKATDDMLGIVMAIVDVVMREYPIDPERVYVSGVSSGGSACWELGIRHAERFAAIAPLGSMGTVKQEARRLVGIPLRAFHSTYDMDAPVDSVRRTIYAINSAGGTASLVEIESGRHDCWTAAFQEHHLLEWMLLQKRGSPPRGLLYWSILDTCQSVIARLGPVVLGSILLIAAWRSETRRRRNVGKAATQTPTDTIETANVNGFTLIEMLVVIAIIGVLIGLTIPAVQMARETSRRSSCANHLRQQAVAVRLHEQTHKSFPTGGWKDCLGDPDGGYGPKQPGGWIYNVLSYIEEDSLRQLGRGLKGQPKEQALTLLMQSHIEVFYCPSRRLARLYPYTGGVLKNAKPPKEVAKTDYAISATISYEKSEVIMSDIQLAGKGVSKTVLAGEKSLSADAYDSGSGAGDTLVAYVGDSDDIRRQPTESTISDNAGGTGFGGPHPGGANLAYCDGSVKFINDDESIEP